MGIRHVVLAVNKIDLVDFSEARFNEIRDDFMHATRELGFRQVTAIPLSALLGDNVTVPSARMPWYTGPTLLDHLETVEITNGGVNRPFRMPVQWVNRYSSDFRGYAGTIASGTVRPGDRLTVYPAGGRNGVTARVARIVTMDGDLPSAGPGDAITLTFEEEIDVSRGNVLASGAPLPSTDRFDAHLIWLAEAPLFPGRSYLVKLGTATVAATVTRMRHRLDIDTYEHVAADSLGINDVAHVTIDLGAPVAVERYGESRDLGGFMMIDRLTNATVAVGMVETVAAASGNIVWHTTVVDKHARAVLKGQRPVAIWFTGLSGAGKSTIANLVEQKLHVLGRHTMMLDGDNVRHGLNRDLGFSEADRIENIRRAAEAARLMVDAGLIALVSFISPYRSDRDSARERFEPGEFIEVFVDTPVDECRRRDPKGLYKRADAGQIRNFTGVDAPYEVPLAPEMRLPTVEASAEELAERVVAELQALGVIGG